MNRKAFLTEGNTNLINSRLERPPCPLIQPAEEDFTFFCIDIENYTGKAPNYVRNVDGTKDTTVMRLHGVTSLGNSITVHSFNFKPYFYIQIPNSMEIDEKEMDELRRYFNTKISNPNGIESCEFVMSRSIMHYNDKMTRFIKVTAVLASYIGQLKLLVEKGLAWSND